jgi:hypothetical protein
MLALSGSALAETPALPSALSKGARGALELSVLQELRKGMQGRSGRNGAPPAFDVGLAPPSSALSEPESGNFSPEIAAAGSMVGVLAFQP